MRVRPYISIGALIFVLTTGYAQQPAPLQVQLPPAAAVSGDHLLKFNLDFPGGHPRDLVAYIEKAQGHPLNVIIPDDLAETELPRLIMNNVDVDQLFDALELASHKTQAYVTGNNGVYGGGQSWSQMNTSYGFRTSGKHTDDSIWYFYAEKPNMTPPSIVSSRTSRFYELAPYLDRGFTVDDITTAVRTGWKMLGYHEAPGKAEQAEFAKYQMPDISFHKETQLLIAVGDPDKLSVIDDVLRALQTVPPKNAASPFNPVVPGQPGPRRALPPPTAQPNQ